MFKARHKLLPGNILKYFKDREGRYELRKELNFKHLWANTTMKSTGMLVSGVQLWNGLPEDIQNSINIIQFKKRIKLNMLEKYRQEN